VIVVNFKAYEASTGEEARKLAEKCGKASRETGHRVIVAPQHPDILRIDAEETDLFGQHMDPVDTGSHTGHTTAEVLKRSGVSGTLLNHSERRIPDKIEDSINKADEAGLETIVCAQNPEECGRMSSYGPDYVAYEPPELIGGNKSVSKARPGLIEEAVERSSVDVLTGAGVKSTEDVSRSIELGCQGVLVASGVVKSKDPYKEMMDLCRGL